jgi:hypothetical protein
MSLSHAGIGTLCNKFRSHVGLSVCVCVCVCVYVFMCVYERRGVYVFLDV